MITVAFLLLFKSLFLPKWQCIPSQSQAENLRIQKGMKQCLEQKIKSFYPPSLLSPEGPSSNLIF